MKGQTSNTKQHLPDTPRLNLEQDIQRRRRYGFVLLIIIFLLLAWVLWGTYRAGNLGLQGKTLWDWMELLIVPVFLAFAAFLLNKSQKEVELSIAESRRSQDQQIAERKVALERELTKDKQQQETLDAYLDRMTSLLLNNELRESQEKSEVRSIARTLTLTALRGLDESRKSLVVQFLYESGLIIGSAVVDMSFADLRNINLEYAKLDGISLPKANLRGANLQSASLIGANFYYADLDEVNFSWAKLMGANLRSGLNKADLGAAMLDEANLVGANLSGASLLNAKLRGANLRHANLKFINELLGEITAENLLKANLSLADLTNADLTGAKVDPDQLQVVGSLMGTIMPNGTDFEQWLKELSSSDDGVQNLKHI